jgi:hypothetical protein
LKSVALTLTLAAVCCAAAKDVTFHRDVLPVLQNRCQGCHRPGEAAPFSLLTYKDARPWAKAIRQAVASRKMPPWFASPAHGKFLNDPSMTAAEIATITSWVDAGAPAGNPADAPKPLRFAEGWNIAPPDVVFDAPPFSIPASGEVEYQYLLIPTRFAEDRWIQMAEARPGAREQVHHILVYIREPGSNWMRELKAGEWYYPKRAPGVRTEEAVPVDLLTGYAPGFPPAILPEGLGILVKAGAEIILQMHYTVNGKASEDRTRLGLVFAKQPPQMRVFTGAASNTKLAIPPGAANHRVDSTLPVTTDALLIGMAPHMHMRGKSFRYDAVYPDGRRETLLDVPRYDFNWQLQYAPAKPLPLPAGSRIECSAVFDNSANNPFNPDPKATVRWGDQTWEEMMIGFVYLAVDAGLDQSKLVRERTSLASR